VAERARDRVLRMLGVVNYLEAHGDTSFADLAAQFGTTEEQIHRDVFTLWMAGLPGYMPDDLVDFDADLIDQGVARLTAAQGLRQVRLQAREAVALLGALASFEASGAAPAAVSSASAKIRAALGAEGLGAAAVVARGSADLDPAVMATVRDAIAGRHTVHLDYVTASDRKSTREVEPHRLVAIGDVAYLECYCRLAQDYRTLRLDRITQARPGDNAVVTPPADQVGFTLHSAFQATVVVAREAQRAVEDMPGVQLTTRGDDVVATFGVTNMDVVAGRILAVAPLVRSVEPQALREAIAARAQALLAAQDVGAA